MTMTATLTQALPAIAGNDTNYVLTVFNSSGSAVNVNSINPTVTAPNGRPTTSCLIGAIGAPPGFSTAIVGATQFNVAVPANGSTSFPYSIQFNGPLVTGAPATPASQFVVGAVVQSSDGSVFTPPALTVNLNSPVYGLSPGSPPNTSPVVPSLNFTTPANSALAL